MGKWDKYRIDEDTTPVNKWDKYQVISEAPVEEAEGDSWPALIGKSAYKGLASMADIPSLVAQGAEKLVNLGRKTSGNPAEVYWAAQNPNITNKPKITPIVNAPQTDYSKYVPSSEHVKSGVKELTGIDLEPNPTSPAQKIVSKGVDFGASMTPWGASGKALNLTQRLKNAAKASKEATAVGVGSGVLEEAGADPLAADLISSVATPYITPHIKRPTIKGIKQVPLKAKLWATGLGPSKINIEAGRAARDLGIDLPATVLTDSTLTGLADQTVSKTPIFGNILKNKYDQVKEKTHKNLTNIYDEIGPIRTPEVSKKIHDLYSERKRALPEESVIIPTSTAKKLEEIEQSFLSDISSPDRVKLKKYIGDLRSKIDPKIDTQYGDIKIPLQQYKVNKLIDAKVNINDIVNHDVQGDSLNRLMEINHAISEDLARYGKKNPDWYKKFKKADEYFSSVARREKTEKLLKKQATIDDPEELSYAALNNSINNRNTERLLKKNTSPETFEKIKKLGIVSKAMVQKNRRVPNPSGTAVTALSLGMLSGAFLDPSTLITGTGGASLFVTGLSTKLLTDKKFLNLALDYAEEQGKAKLATSMKLNKRSKDITGYTLNSIYRAARDLNKEEEQDELQ